MIRTLGLWCAKRKTKAKDYFFFLKNLLLQSDVVFDSDLNNCNFHSLAPPDDEKKNIFDFFNFFFDFFFNLFFGFLQLIFSA